MPMKSLVLIGGLVFFPLSSLFADPPGKVDPAQKYADCLAAQRKSKVSSLKSSCATLQSESAMAACNIQADNFQSDSSTIEYCKISSGLLDPTQRAFSEAKFQDNQSKTANDDAVPDDNGIEVVSRAYLGAQKSSSVSTPLTAPIPGQRPSDGGTSATQAKAKAQPDSSDPNASNSQNNDNGNSSNNNVQQQNSPYDDTSSAQSQASADISTCQSQQSSAYRTCSATPNQSDVSRLRSLANSGDQAGLKTACQQMQQAADTGSSVNINLGANCTATQTTCSLTCASLVRKYQSLQASCGDCQSSSIYSSALSSLTAAQAQCDGLQARADALSRQGLQASSSAYASYCQDQMDASSAQSMGGLPGAFGGFGSSSGSASSVQQQQQGQAQADPAARGQASFQNGMNSTTPPKFNLGDYSGVTTQPYILGGRNDNSPTVATIPNNQGGQMPNTPASPNAAAARAASPNMQQAHAGASSITDIDQGFRSGVSPQGSGFDLPQARPQRRPTSTADQSGLLGMDLKQFLPGGSRDPSRRLAGSAWPVEIGAKEGDIWTKISNKMMEKCKLGVLWNCR
jgi:hypothetical protein